MENILLNGDEYHICTDINDLTLGKYCKLTQILGRREKVVDIETIDGDTLYKTLEPQEETTEFKRQVELDFLTTVTDIPLEFFVDYPELTNEVNQVVGDIFTDEEEVWTQIDIQGTTYEIPEITQWTFQEWCDMEGAIQMIEENTILMLLAMILRPVNSSYDRFHPTYMDKYVYLSSLPAKGNVVTIMQIITDMKPMRDAHPFIYTVSVGEAVSKHMKAHYERMKWEDTIVSLAQINVFNSDEGTLKGVRNANVLDVLQYLNVKKSRDTAEYLDSKQKNKSLNDLDI